MNTLGGTHRQDPGWAAEAREWIRSEPALAWFLEQAVYLAQPVLEAFWTPDAITQFASGLTWMESPPAEDAGTDKGSNP
jgi:hypothetical protein